MTPPGCAQGPSVTLQSSWELDKWPRSRGMSWPAGAALPCGALVKPCLSHGSFHPSRPSPSPHITQNAWFLKRKCRSILQQILSLLLLSLFGKLNLDTAPGLPSELKLDTTPRSRITAGSSPSGGFESMNLNCHLQLGLVS